MFASFRILGSKTNLLNAALDSGIAVEKDNRPDDESPTDDGSQSASEKPDFYNKSSSFFDSISCEALEKEEG